MKIIGVEKSRIFDAAELEKIAEKCANLGLNLVVFGLPQSGKSSLVRAICRKSKGFVTLEEEEVLEEAHVAELRKGFAGKKWAIGHQFPTMDENVSDSYLGRFFVENMGLNPKEWAIIRIKTK